MKDEEERKKWGQASMIEKFETKNMENQRWIGDKLSRIVELSHKAGHALHMYSVV